MLFLDLSLSNSQSITYEIHIPSVYFYFLNYSYTPNSFVHMSSIFYININNHENTSSSNHNLLEHSHDKNIGKLNKLLIDPESVIINYET